jgi:hypothetical protein
MIRGRPRLAAWLRSTAFSLALAALVAAALADRHTLFPVFVLGVAAIGLGTLFLLFPRGIHFAFGAANGFAVYACLFALLGRSGFPDAPDWSRGPAFLLPVAAFLGAVWWRRAALRPIAEAREPLGLDHLGPMARWLLLVCLVGILSLSAPINRLDPGGQAVALMLAMSVIATLVALSVSDVVRFLTDIALLLEDLAERGRRLVVPVATFLSLYTLVAIVFAAFYRIADGMSRVPLFHDVHGPIVLDFGSALHFSIVTLSTVGYGDIRPTDDGIRLLAAAEVMTGQVLLLFGFAEILGAHRRRSSEPDATAPPERGRHSAAIRRHDSEPTRHDNA